MQFLRKIGPGKPRIFPRTAELAKRTDMVPCDENGNRIVKTEPVEDLEEDVVVGDAPGATLAVNEDNDGPVEDPKGDEPVGGDESTGTPDSETGEFDLEACSFAQLRAHAKKMGVQQSRTETRVSLTEKIREASA